MHCIKTICSPRLQNHELNAAFAHKNFMISSTTFTTQYYFTPHYHQSNVHVERAIQTVKLSLTHDDSDIVFMLLDYNTIENENLPSPAQMLMGRRLKNTLPIHSDLLEPAFPAQEI